MPQAFDSSRSDLEFNSLNNPAGLEAEFFLPLDWNNYGDVYLESSLPLPCPSSNLAPQGPNPQIGQSVLYTLAPSTWAPDNFHAKSSSNSATKETSDDNLCTSHNYLRIQGKDETKDLLLSGRRLPEVPTDDLRNIENGSGNKPQFGSLSWNEKTTLLDGEGPARPKSAEGDPKSTPQIDLIQVQPPTLAEHEDTTEASTELSDGVFDGSSARTNTLSSFTEDDMDSGPDEITGSLQDFHFSDFSSLSNEGLLSQDQVRDTVTRPVLSQVKQDLISRIMNEFWALIDQQTPQISCRVSLSPTAGTNAMEQDSKQLPDPPCDGGAESSQPGGSNSLISTANNIQNMTQSSLGWRGTDARDVEDPNDDEERSPKRPRPPVSPPQDPDKPKYACPYRKRDPRKYCLQHWRACALTPQDSVARVK
jgi:hypothetical protein